MTELLLFKKWKWLTFVLPIELLNGGFQEESLRPLQLCPIFSFVITYAYRVKLWWEDKSKYILMLSINSYVLLGKNFIFHGTNIIFLLLDRLAMVNALASHHCEPASISGVGSWDDVWSSVRTDPHRSLPARERFYNLYCTCCTLYKVFF